MEIEEIETRWGTIFVMGNDRPIASSLEAYGEWAQIEIEFLAQFIAEGYSIIDAGAHVGIHSLALADLSRETRIHSFEAQPQLAALLMRNTTALRNRITVYPCAISGSDGTGFMSELPDERYVNAGAQSLEHRPGEGRIDVPIRALDSLGLNGVKFIKLDIEGCEAAALQGAARTIARDRPTIYCEVNSIGAASDIFRAMQGRDYAFYFVSTPAFNPENFRFASSNLFGVAHESALLLLPADHLAPEIRRASVCCQVHNLDEFAQHFIKVPRYGDERDHDRDAQSLRSEGKALREKLALDKAEALRRDQEHAQSKAETDALREQSRAYQRELTAHADRAARAQAEIDALAVALREARAERAQREQMLTVARNRIDALEEELGVQKQRYHALAPFLWKSDLAARRRSIVGPIARRLGYSELARACRTLTGSGLFDRKWYKQAYGDVAASEHEPVVHYLLFGAFEGRKPNRIFDSAYYLRENPDVRHSGMNPLLHYIHYGERENRRPSADFDPASFLVAHPALKGPGGSLLKHFLAAGGIDAPVMPPFKPVAPDWSAFEALAGSSRDYMRRSTPLVDVIIPVYRGYDDTLSCIFSVLTSRNTTPFELLVIDDASPEPALSEALDRLSDMELITLLRNERNLGFVGTVNRGMATHPERDVLLLNSDTLVFNDWLDRIHAHSLMLDIATVTPFTNNGTICSYPEFCKDNRNELEIAFSEVDLLAAAMNRQQAVDVPTGVGFCMYITRKALDEVGLFDVETFGKGYGEENDFCVRASERGLRNLHALDVFVFHSGETSFGAGATQAKKTGLNALTAKHPGYIREVEKYVVADPAKEARARLDIGRLLKRPPERITLCFTHLLGGGIARYLTDRAASMGETGEGLLLAVPASPEGRAIRLMGIDDTPYLPNLREFDIDKDGEAFAQFLKSIAINAIEVHSTVGWSSRALQFIPMVARSLGMPFDFMAHDYVPICPQINLINQSGIYCGEQGNEQCSRCLSALTKLPRMIHPDAAASDMADVAGWRKEYGRFLLQAREIAAPSLDTAKRFQKYFPTIQVEVRPHKERGIPHSRRVAAPYAGESVQVAVIGAIGPHKGADILERCAEDAQQRGLPLHFTVVGYTSIPDLANKPNVTVTGAYAEHEVYDRLAEAGPHVAFLPSVWPETYCYTLSIAMAAGLPVFAFDIGAPAERLRAKSGGVLMSTSMMADARAINDRILDQFAMQTMSSATASY
ncbi:MAG: FkbM family methyltransferase [Parvibaculum sedimenti]|uniref:FkbM family methyltransferase n=1 Tax=Parvibaculum sedimenti TaxID=2608632 RepID=UPI003BB6084C